MLSKAKRELRALTDNSFKTFLITLLSFILLFSISCKNDGKTGGGGGGNLDDIPTATGTEANASELQTYAGSYEGTIGSAVTRKSYNSNPSDFGDNFSLEANGNNTIQVVITDNKIYYTGMSGDESSKTQIYKSAGSFIASEEVTIEDGLTYKSYIRINFNPSSPNQMSIYLHMGMKMDGGGYNGVYTAEYEGTLTKK